MPIAPDETVLPRRLTLSVIDEDPDYLLLNVFVSDGQFAGATRVYESRSCFAVLARTIAGFPSKSSDSRDALLGDFGPKTAGGGARLHFRTLDSVGHAVVRVELEDEPTGSDVSPRAVVVHLLIDAAVVDQFVAQLRLARPEPNSTATLLGAS